MKSNCKWCGDEYIKKYGRLYCSEKCKNDARNESRKITGLTLEQKTAIIFYRNKTDLGDDKIANILGVRRERVRGFKTSIQAKEMGITDYGLKSRNNNTGKIKPEEQFKKDFNHKFPNYEYISGYTGFDCFINVKCKKCGHVFNRTAMVMYDENEISCPSCIEIKQKHKELEKELKRISWRLKHIQKEIEYKKSLTGQICIECGEKFTASRLGVNYCSKKCNNKAQRRNRKYNKEVRYKLAKNNGKFDNDIDLIDLAKRDNNICYLCGEKVTFDDYKITEEGYFIANGTYPSIDHIKPISKGGTHTWDNVKLAHMECNCLKSDKLIEDLAKA